jgi:hypothetical protein
MHLQMRSDVAPGGGSAGLAIAITGGDALLAVVDAGTNELRLERRLAGVHHVIEQAGLPAITGPVQLDLIGYDDMMLARVGQTELRMPRDHQREGRVALVGSAGARFTRFAVEPVEAYAIDLTTSRWHSFDEHVAAYRDGAALTIGTTRAEASTWLGAQWDAIAAVMASDADPRARAGVFRGALEALGIPAIENPAAPLLTPLRSESAGIGLLLEGPEPMAVARDVKIRLQRRRRRRPPFGDVHPPLDGSVIDTRRREANRRAPATDRLDIDLDLAAGHDRDLFPIDLVQWIDIDTLVLSDDAERAALILPVDPVNRTLVNVPVTVLRIIFQLDRERYRSAIADPQSRYTATVTRLVDW